MTPQDLSYGPLNEEDFPQVARIISHAFAGTREGSREWLTSAGPEHVRVLRTRGPGDAVAACLLRIPMGEFFGGRSVPMVGIAGVGVAPEFRGRGVAGRLMAEAVREIAAEGVPLSGLYPATQPLYRRAGYEQAGHRFELRLPLRNIDVRERSMRVREVQEGDRAAVRECYRAFALRFDGPLDRGPYVWGRVEKNRDVDYHGFAAVDERDRIEGYLYLSQVRRPDRGRHDLALSDLAFTTARAGRRLLAFLEDFSSTADDVVFYGGPMHPALSLLGEQRYEMTLRDHWMLRVIDVLGVMRARGFRCDDVEVHVDVRDDLLPQNAGRWVLGIRGGVGTAERGGEGHLKLDIGALAPLFAGYMSPEQLALLGRCDGPPAAFGAASRMFAGTTPWMGDMY